jgi:hypothetical protein
MWRLRRADEGGAGERRNHREDDENHSHTGENVLKLMLR